MTWTFWGNWREYKPRRDDLPPTHFMTNGQIDWYDLAHGRLADMGYNVPKNGWWVVVDPRNRHVLDTEPAHRLQWCAPVGYPIAELWWTDEEPLEYPYRGDDGWILVETDGKSPPSVTRMRRVPHEEA